MIDIVQLLSHETFLLALTDSGQVYYWNNNIKDWSLYTG